MELTGNCRGTWNSQYVSEAKTTGLETSPNDREGYFEHGKTWMGDRDEATLSTASTWMGDRDGYSEHGKHFDG